MAGMFDDIPAGAASPTAAGIFDDIPTRAPVMSASDRFGSGMLDPFAGTAQTLAHTLPQPALDAINWLRRNVTGAKGDVTPAGVDAKVAQREGEIEAGMNGATDWARIGGNTAAMLPLAAGGAPAGFLANVALNTGIGAAANALNPVTDQPADFWAAKGDQATSGALGGAVGGAALSGLSRFVQPKISAAVQDMIDRGVIPKPGQVLGGPAQWIEDKLTSFPVVGEFMKGGQRRAVEQFNRAVYNDVLEPIGQKYDGQVGREAVGNIADTLSGKYEELLPKLQFKSDPQFASDFSNLVNLASNMPRPQVKRFDEIVTNNLLSRLGPDGGMDGQTLKGVESELTRLAKGYNGDASFDNRQLGSAIDELLSVVRQNLQRANPAHADDLASLNMAWAKYTRLRGAASMLGANEGVFNPAQFLNAVKAGDKSVGKGQFARGGALMQDLAENGKAVLGSTYPDSGTAGRAGLAGVVGGLLAHGGIDPHLLAGMGALSLPYLPPVQKGLAYTLTKRPTAVTEPIAGLLQRSAPLAGIAARGLLAQ